MKEKLNCLMLIDDNPDDNFFHEREIKKTNQLRNVIVKTSGLSALEYLKLKREPHADLIFLDINMPRMNGWEFLEEYNLLSKESQSLAIIIMLTTSGNPEDIERAKKWSFVSDFKTKPLTREVMDEIIAKYFNN
jgi:CheY-like chemotaxis protein